MRNLTQTITRRRALARFLPALIALLAACGGNAPPELIIPTPAVTAEAGRTATPTATSVANPPTPTVAAPPATSTLPAPPTVAPPLPTPTTGPLPTATAVSTAPDGYQVAFVAANDVLNVRRQPGANAAVVGRLAPDATGIQITGEGQNLFGSNLWVPVESDAGEGWVNSRFLTETISREMFCSDPAVEELLDQFVEAVEEEDGKRILELVHPDRGLRVRVSWWNPEVLFRGQDIQTIFRAEKKYDWGVADGSGEPLSGSFSEIVMPHLERDLLEVGEWRCDEGQFGPTAGSTILPEGYEQVRFYSAHRPAPADVEMDWGTWLIGVEHWEGRYYVSYLVHYRWEI